MAYTPPTVDAFRLRFPEFENQEDARIQLFIDDAVRLIDESYWVEADFQVAVLYLAAFLLEDGSYTASVTTSGLPGAVQSQSLRGMSQSYAIAGRSDASIYKANRYGQYFLWMLRRVRPAIEVI